MLSLQASAARDGLYLVESGREGRAGAEPAQLFVCIVDFLSWVSCGGWGMLSSPHRTPLLMNRRRRLFVRAALKDPAFDSAALGEVGVVVEPDGAVDGLDVYEFAQAR